MYKYKAIVTSNSSYGREYNVSTSSAYKAAQMLGRCENGEIVRIYTKSGRLVSEARWVQEDGGKYRRCQI